MSELSARSLLVAAGLSVLVGCGGSYGHHQYVGYHHHHHRGGSDGVAAVVGTILLIDAIAHLASDPPPPPPPTAVYVYSAPPPVIVAAPPPTAPKPAAADELPPLDPTATRAAFAEADLSGCHAPPVYGHAKITLNPDGHVSRVVVEDPSDLDPSVAQCIGKHIGAVSVPPFRGGLVILGTTFKVQEE
jgi:hypothetical protein